LPQHKVSEIIEFANRGKLSGKLAKSFWQSCVICNSVKRQPTYVL